MNAHLNTLTAGALERLTKAVGRAAAERYAKEALGRLGVRELSTPDDLLEFANYLLKQGGVVESVGRALKVTAILRGAREE
jgi:hypothetical protein